ALTLPLRSCFEEYGLQPVHQATKISRALAPEGRTRRTFRVGDNPLASNSFTRCHPDVARSAAEGSAVKISSIAFPLSTVILTLSAAKWKDPRLHFHGLGVPSVMYDCGCLSLLPHGR